MIKPNKTGLGRGLDALISMDDTTTDERIIPSSINEIELDDIHANPSQPRHDFDQQALEELAASIKSIGIIQPITLRQEEDGSYMIVAGERRFRAAQIAGLETVPAYIIKVSDDDVMEMALIRLEWALPVENTSYKRKGCIRYWYGKRQDRHKHRHKSMHLEHTEK